MYVSYQFASAIAELSGPRSSGCGSPPPTLALGQQLVESGLTKQFRQSRLASKGSGPGALVSPKGREERRTSELSLRFDVRKSGSRSPLRPKTSQDCAAGAKSRPRNGGWWTTELLSPAESGDGVKGSPWPGPGTSPGHKIERNMHGSP